MTPQYILRQSLSRHPHCFSAYVPGQGYINKGESLADNCADYWRQYHRTALADIENLNWAPKYTEPGYQNEQPKHGVLFANWNHFPSKVTDILERAGYAIEWEDEWTTCDDCQGAVRTQPNSHDWEPTYTQDDNDGSVLCLACVEANEPQEDEDDA